MADCAPLLDEELSSFVFNYLTENSGSQYGEEEVCSDRLDTDFPDIDLSQLDTSDFDSVNCLSELQWCNDQPADTSPTSIHYSTPDELFEIEEENAALLAALTDSLDGMVDAEVGGLSVFPALGGEPCQEDEEEDNLPLSAEDFSQSMGSETDDPSLLMKLLLTPPNVPAAVDAHKDRVHGHRYSNRSLHLRQTRPLVKSDLRQERKPRAVRPAGRLCTELHRHLTTARQTGDTPAPDTEEDEEEEDDEDSDSEEDEEDEEEEEEESSSSEVEGVAVVAPAEPPKPQFSSEKELHSVVELITYMHTYCLPTRKQQGWDRKDRDAPRPRARPEGPRTAATNSHSRVVLVAASGTGGGLTGPSGPRRLPFARRREMKANSLLRELLQQSSSYDVSKPYRLHSPPYAHSHSPSRVSALTAKSAQNYSHSSTTHKPELRKDSSSHERRSRSSEAQQSPDEAAEDGGSFSVRRSRRLASFPSRFAKRLRPGRAREGERKDREEREEGRGGVKLLLTQAGGGTTMTETQAEQRTTSFSTTEPNKPCCHNEKRACLCLTLNTKSTGESQFSTKPFEQTLSVDLCGTAGLTPPTTPPHKPVEDELFKPAEGGKGGEGTGVGSGGDGGGGCGESVHSASSTNAAAKASSRPSRANHQRKLPEQTELYAQLRRMGQAGDSDTHRTFGDHDYCALSLGESRKRSAAMLGAILQAQGGGDGVSLTLTPREADHQVSDRNGKENGERLVSKIAEQLQQQTKALISSSPLPPSRCQSTAATPPFSEEEAERSSASRSPSPILHLCPDSPASKTDSSENSEICTDDKQRNKAKSDEDNCQVFYIHNLPTSVTQNMLRKRFQVFGKPEDCKVIICNEERCGVIKIRQAGVQKHWRERETVFQNGPAGLRRLTRKRYIDLDEAGPGPVKSKYDALDFDTLLKEAQKSLHR
ncbi:peroxisome proliferator-activated receptor gamma coactivator 1-beta [Anoplopoma fimbria]|uniref:peroxisome proliferator-activated receptor gamma coactivator 1-beta n=1 Tax=Anoplopoma fimbria TaxID=229290 RepID=UPI0023EBB182|nr:peroxisome proliferator-activated receptor gamma coactivator 1-beta [Anoplopoma fimbria]